MKNLTKPVAVIVAIVLMIIVAFIEISDVLAVIALFSGLGIFFL